MPSTNEESLWAAVIGKKFDKAEQIITEHPEEDLINAVHPVFSTLFKLVSMGLFCPMDFIKFMVNHKQFNIGYHTSKISHVESMIHVGSAEVFKVFETNEHIIFNGMNGLSYTYAKNWLGSRTADYELEYKKDPNSVNTKLYEEKIKGLQYIVPKLLELTLQHNETIILRALELNEPILLEQLEMAGVNLAKPLTDGSKPLYFLKNLKSIIFTASTEAFKLFENEPDVISLEQDLSYFYAKKCLATKMYDYRLKCKKNPNSDIAIFYAEKIKNLECIVGKLLEKTVQQVVATNNKQLRERLVRQGMDTDDPAVFAQLENAGDELSDPLSDGTLPIHLLKRTGTEKVAEWFTQRYKRKHVEIHAISTNPHVMEMFRAVQAKQEALVVNFHTTQAKLYEESAEELTGLLNGAMRSLTG